MEDEKSIRCCSNIEQLCRKLFLVIVVQGTINMTTFILVLETAIDNQNFIELVLELAIEDVTHGAFLNSGEAVRLIFGDEVRYLESVRFFEIHH